MICVSTAQLTDVDGKDVPIGILLACAMTLLASESCII